MIKTDREKVGRLADVIAYLNKYHDSTSEAYQHRNPGLLKDKYTNETRQFICTFDGYKALMDSLEKYCISYPSCTVAELVNLYGCSPDTGIIIDFMDVPDEKILEFRLNYFYGD